MCAWGTAHKKMTADRGKQQAEPAWSERCFKILSHPLRQQILTLLTEMHEGSPTQLADRLGEPVGNISYHFKVLAQGAAIELVRTEPRRGALEHFYRPITRTAHISRTLLHLDDEGHRAVADLLDETARRLDQIEAEVHSRGARGDGEPPESEVAMLHLHLQGDGDGSGQ